MKCIYNSKVRENNMPDLIRAWFSAFRCCYCSQVRTGRSRTGDCSEQGGLQQLTKVGQIRSPKVSPRLALNFSFHIPYKKSSRTYFKQTVCTRVLWTWNTITAWLGVQVIQETTGQPNKTLSYYSVLFPLYPNITRTKTSTYKNVVDNYPNNAKRCS